MLASIFILSAAVLLLAYWCRYTCHLLIQSAPAGHSGNPANPYHLSFPDVQKALEQRPGPPALDALERSLDSDYRILLYLLQHSPGLDVSAAERRLLIVDYRLMRVWYRIVRRASPERARRAVLEMSQVLGFFSQKMGERNTQQALA